MTGKGGGIFFDLRSPRNCPDIFRSAQEFLELFYAAAMKVGLDLCDAIVF